MTGGAGFGEWESIPEEERHLEREHLGWLALAGLVAFVVVCIIVGGAVGLWVFAQAVEWVGSGE